MLEAAQSVRASRMWHGREEDLGVDIKEKSCLASHRGFYTKLAYTI